MLRRSRPRVGLQLNIRPIRRKRTRRSTRRNMRRLKANTPHIKRRRSSIRRRRSISLLRRRCSRLCGNMRSLPHPAAACPRG